MKKIRFLALLLTIISFVYPAAQQIWLPNGVWNLTSYKGIYESSGNAKNWNDDAHSIIEDIADDDITYLVPNTANTDHLYNVASGASATMAFTANTSTQVGATIGIFAIRGGTSPGTGSTLDGTETGSIKMKFTTFHDKSVAETMYSMYVAGGSNRPAIRLYFQGNYQGDKFRIKFGNDSKAYVGYFDYRNTFDTPAQLKDEATDVSSNSVTSADIEDIFDFNITDNNTSSMLNSTFSLTNDVKKLDSASGDTLIVHYYNKNGVWDTYNSANTNSKSNAFSQLDVGKAYWIKADSQLANDDGNNTRLGLITSDDSQLKEDYLSKVGNGWNLLVLEESHIRYTTSGIAMTGNFAGTLILPRKPEQITTVTALDIPIRIPLSAATAGNLHQNVRIINSTIYAINVLYGLNTRMRAFPAADLNGNAALILLSDDLIYIDPIATAGVIYTTLTGEGLLSLPETRAGGAINSSRHGEYMLAATLNEINGSDINATININTPSITSTTGIASDLNSSSNIAKAVSIFEALTASSTDSSNNLKTNVNVWLIDTELSATKTYPTTSAVDLANAMNSVLIASGERFSISDNTYTKAYKYNKSGDFRILGSVSRDITLPNTTNSMAALEAAFDNVQDVTNVDFHNIGQDVDGDSYFVISSNQASNIDLLENENNGTTLFEEISLGSTVIAESNRTFMQGAVSKVHNIANLLNTRIDFNTTIPNRPAGLFETYAATQINALISPTPSELSGVFKESPTAMTLDLKTNVVWALDFPMNALSEKLAKYNKKIDSILTSDITSEGSNIWRATDLTKPPEDWYGNNYGVNNANKYNNDYQSIFRINSNKAYWAKISPKTRITGSISPNSLFSQNVTPHFDNDVDSVNNPIAPTYNDIDHKLAVYLDSNFINPLTHTFYDVIAIIDGRRYHMRSSGSNFQLDIRNKEMDLAQKNAGESAYPILIEAHDGLGNVFAETISTNKFNINFVKPATPKLTYTDEGELVISNRGSMKIQAYTGYISDIESTRSSNKMDFNETHFITRFPDNVGWERNSATTDDDGTPVVLKIVAWNQTTKMYSDALTSIYIPLNFGHVLEVNSTDLDNVDSIPYSFIQKQYLTKQSVNTKNKVIFNGSNGINGGVQLNKQQQAISNNNKGIKFVYYPSGGADKEDSNEITRFGGRYTMYLKVNTNDQSPIASITYIPDLVDDIFYIEYDDQIYMGRFSGTTNFNTDASAYILKDSDAFDITTLQSGSAYSLETTGRWINFGSGVSGQKIFNGIVDPNKNNNNNNNNNNQNTAPNTPTAVAPANTGLPPANTGLPPATP